MLPLERDDSPVSVFAGPVAVLSLSLPVAWLRSLEPDRLCEVRPVKAFLSADMAAADVVGKRLVLLPPEFLYSFVTAPRLLVVVRHVSKVTTTGGGRKHREDAEIITINHRWGVVVDGQGQA